MAKSKGKNIPENYSEENLFAVQESYKAIRTNIILSVIKDGCKKIVVTSSVADEGKSTTAVNLAISLAQAFNKVLIVDCDLRKPRVHKALGMPKDPGLTNLVSGLSEYDDVIQQTKYQNLSMLAVGLNAPNPAEILASQRMLSVTEKLEKNFDYIIFDTPPVNIVSDALPVISFSDGTVLVVRSGVSVYSEIDKALASLKFIEAKIIGIIVNGDDSEVSGSHYGKYGKYGKYGQYGQYGDKQL